MMPLRYHRALSQLNPALLQGRPARYLRPSWWARVRAVGRAVLTIVTRGRF